MWETFRLVTRSRCACWLTLRSPDRWEEPVVLVDLGVVEQRYRAVLEVLDGASVVEVARRNAVSRQTVHG